MRRLFSLFVALSLMLLPDMVRGQEQAVQQVQGLEAQGLEAQNGDWYLLCDNFYNCSIRGVVEVLQSPAQKRALVMVDRMYYPNADWQIRMVFLDEFGDDQLKEALPEALELKSRANSANGFLLGLTGGAGNPIRDLPAERGSEFLSFLVQNDGAEVYALEDIFARMPRGDLQDLLSEAEQAQQAQALLMGTEELEANGDLSRFVVSIFASDDIQGSPEPVLEQPCGQEDTLGSRTWLMDQGARLWLVACEAEVKIFLQPRFEPVRRVVFYDELGMPYTSKQVEFDGDTGLLTMNIQNEQNSGAEPRLDCGSVLTSGWGGDEGFIPILTTKMALCRNIPSYYWPTYWEQDSWRIIGSTLDHGA